MAAFVPLPFCSHSLMDRISDSGSDGLGSNPDGSTTTVKFFSPDEMNRQGFAEDLACSYFVVFQEFGRGPGNHRHQTYDMEMKDSMYDNPRLQSFSNL